MSLSNRHLPCSHFMEHFYIQALLLLIQTIQAVFHIYPHPRGPLNVCLLGRVGCILFYMSLFSQPQRLVAAPGREGVSEGQQLQVTSSPWLRMQLSQLCVTNENTSRQLTVVLALHPPTQQHVSSGALHAQTAGGLVALCGHPRHRPQ